MQNHEEVDRHAEKESVINKTAAIVVSILSAALIAWAGYHIYMAASSEKRQGVTRIPETAAQIERGRELLEKEKRDKEDLESAQRMMHEREAAERQEQIRFGQ